MAQKPKKGSHLTSVQLYMDQRNMGEQLLARVWEQKPPYIRRQDLFRRMLMQGLVVMAEENQLHPELLNQLELDEAYRYLGIEKGTYSAPKSVAAPTQSEPYHPNAARQEAHAEQVPEPAQTRIAAPAPTPQQAEPLRKTNENVPILGLM
ncbi:hypothetical protein ACQU0X_26660 [Pseudovibrio ascidiaceicola]|uniref:hypothetical protein n=1 Tax=Pseudovibrio ascidiaceicola TaxID=285279 RepID=UPI003D369163